MVKTLLLVNKMFCKSYYYNEQSFYVTALINDMYHKFNDSELVSKCYFRSICLPYDI